MRVPIKTYDTKPRSIPGRLLPECNLSSSHDTGLNRLGMPRQVSKGKLQDKQAPPVVTPYKRDRARHSGQPATRSSYEWRAALKSTTDERVPRQPPQQAQTPPDSDNEGYDDVTRASREKVTPQRKAAARSSYEWRAGLKSTTDEAAPRQPSQQAQTYPDSDKEEYDDNTRALGQKVTPQRKAATRSPYEWRAGLKSTDKTTPKPRSKQTNSSERKARTPPDSSGEEYDDVTQTVGKVAWWKDNQTTEQPIRAQVPVSRAVSCGPRITRPEIKPRSQPPAPESASPVARRRKDRPVVPAGAGPSAFADLKKRFESN